MSEDVNAVAFQKIIETEDYVKFRHVIRSDPILLALEIARELTQQETSRERMNECLKALTESIEKAVLNWGEVSDSVSPECYGLGKHEDCSYMKNYNPETDEPTCDCLCHQPDYYPEGK